MMQIKELVLYGKNGKVRHLPFNIGKVNIITGKSESGKTAIGDIIDYCLGGSECNIADGVIRDTVAWYGLLLQFSKERMFVARKNPDAGHQSTSFCYIEIGKTLEVPENGDFISNENVDGLEESLSRRLGISDNLNTPPDGQSRRPLSANIRHSLFYCIQTQTEIAAKDFLFHKQQEDFVTQAIKDTLPFFLGVIDENSMALENELSILKRELTIEKRRLAEIERLNGSGVDRAISLVSEAKQIGLLPENIIFDQDNFDAVLDILKTVNSWTPDTSNQNDIGLDRITYLQSELQRQEGDLEEISIEIDNAKKYAGITSDFWGAVQHQIMRLNSIGLFEQLNFNPDYCPLCSNKMDTPLPSVEMIKASILNLNNNIENVSRETPKIRKFISDLENTRQKLREDIHQLKREIDGIYDQNNENTRIRDLTARRAKVVGRISLWIDSVQQNNDSSAKEESIRKIESRIDELNELLNKDTVEERKLSILSRISADISNWVKELHLEHSENPYRLDINKVTVIVDKPERPVPLQQLGSGQNWVGIHIITYLALQKYFVSAKRPVPSFIFLDQPSQVYFPSEKKEVRQDWDKIKSLYNFIFTRIADYNNNLQIIIVDHADLDDMAFKDSIIADWHGDENLIPVDWITVENKGDTQ